MTKALFTLFALTCLGSSLHGQKETAYRIPAGVEVNKIIPFEDLHLYPDFRKCAIHYVDGKSSLAMVNYSLLYQKMLVITVKKDTTFLKNDYLIEKFDFGDTVILNDYKYGPVLVSADSIFPKFGKRDFYHLIPVEEGTYDGYSNFVDPSSTNIVLRRIGNDTDRVIEDQFARSNLVAEKHYVYFIVDRNERVFPASGKYLYRILPRYKNTIRNYIRSESIDFKNEADLRKLMDFCQGL